MIFSACKPNLLNLDFKNSSRMQLIRFNSELIHQSVRKYSIHVHDYHEIFRTMTRGYIK